MDDKQSKVYQKPASVFFCALPQSASQFEDALISALPDFRKIKAQKYFNNDDRILSAAAWHLLRHSVLTVYNLDIFSFAVCYDQFKKPYFDGAGSNIHFSISHCKMAVACALDYAPLGVDIEKLRALDIKIAHRIMPQHYNTLLDTDSETKDTLFTRLWTQTESIFKAGFTKGHLAPDYLTYDYLVDGHFIGLCAKGSACKPKPAQLSFDDLLSSIKI